MTNTPPSPAPQATPPYQHDLAAGVRIDVRQVDALAQGGRHRSARPWTTFLISKANGTVLAHKVSETFPDASLIVAMLSGTNAPAIEEACGTGMPNLAMDGEAEMTSLGNKLAALGYTVMFEAIGRTGHSSSQ